MRTLAVPPFLQDLLSSHSESGARSQCTCTPRPNDEGTIPWCHGGQYKKWSDDPDTPSWLRERATTDTKGSVRAAGVQAIAKG